MAGCAPAEAIMGGELARRVVTAVALGGVAAAALYAGGAPFGLFLLVVFALLLWEWAGLTLPDMGGADRALHTGYALALAALIAHVAAPGALGLPTSGDVAIALYLAAGGLAAIALTRLYRRDGAPTAPGGAAYKTAAFLGWLIWLAPALAAAVWLRARFGADALLWPVIVVIASDVGAYFVGRAFRGPKLAPTISPGKTWSGFVGGLVAGVLAGIVLSLALHDGDVALAAAVAFAVACVGVVGDLAQSALKRKARVKDSGGLLPGHGGLFDRLDSHLFGLPVFAAAVWAWGWPL